MDSRRRTRGRRELGRRLPGPGAEDQQLRQRVGAEPVGAVDADAGGLPRGVQPLERGRPVDVGVDPAHHVVHDRADRDQLVHGVDALVLQAQLPNEGKLGVDELRAEMAQVEVDDRTPGRVRRTTLLDLVDERLREPVARTELHAAQLRSRGRLAEVVVLEVAVAVLVQQPAALGARRLGDQDAGERKAGRVVLDELHVLERRARAIGERHAVPGVDVGVRGEREDLAAAAGAQDDRLRGDRLDLAGQQADRDDAVHPAVVDQQPGDEHLVVARDLVVLQGGLEQRVQHVEAGLVGREPGALLLHAAERTDRDVAVRLPAPGAAPVLELQQLAGSLVDERLDGVLVAEPVAARDRVVACAPRGCRRRR